MTAEELLRLPDDGWRHELVRGELRTMPLRGAAAGAVAATLIASLNQSAAGAAYVGVGFKLASLPDTVCAPAVAIARRADPANDGFMEGAPDVAFEFADDEIEEKTLDWLRAGTRAVVIVDPRTASVRIHRGDGAIAVTEAIVLDDIIPGWRLPLSELFD